MTENCFINGGDDGCDKLGCFAERRVQAMIAKNRSERIESKRYTYDDALDFVKHCTTVYHCPFGRKVSRILAAHYHQFPRGHRGDIVT